MAASSDQNGYNGPLSFKEALEAAIKDSAALAAAIKASAEQSPPRKNDKYYVEATVLDRPYTDGSFASLGQLVRHLEDLVSSQQAEIEKLKKAKAKSDEELEKEKAIILSLRDALDRANAELGEELIANQKLTKLMLPFLEKDLDNNL